MHEYYGAHTFDQTQGSRLHKNDHVGVLIQGMMTVDLTIHDKMSALWKKGVGGKQLRETVRASYETSYHKFYTSNLHALEQAVSSEFEICMAYKSPRAAYTSETPMKLFISFAQGMHPTVVIWPMEKQDSLRSMVLTVVGVPQATASLVGDVPEKRE